MENRPQKAHRARQSGVKAKKKSGSGKGKQSGFNEKAFAPKSGRRADKQARRNVERDQTRLHVPLVNRTPDDEPPPVIVAIVGPPGVGKTTLMRSLVRRFTKHSLNEIKGPVTVVSGKKRRLTFVECNNDLNSMIDIGKVADLVLLMIDGSFGFEMETFEFLNILQAHGFPKVIGILSHLDLIKKIATQRATKKALKKRFWTEIYQGAKLFYLSGVLNGRYPDQEIQNLSRFISVMKFRPLIFRNTHPYLLADRLEDLTPREQVRHNPKCDRTVTLYGYLRGTYLKQSTAVHIPGAGDLRIASVSVLPDPCPLPTVESEKRRKLSEKMKLIHAPMSDVGGVMYDKDAVYVNVPGSFTRRTGEDGDENVPQGEGERMVMDLQDAKLSLADGISKSSIRLFDTSAAPLGVNHPDSENDGGGGDVPGDVSDESGLSSDVDPELDDTGYESSDQEDATADTHFQNTGRTSFRRPPRSAPTLPLDMEQPGDAVYASSDSDMGELDYDSLTANAEEGGGEERGDSEDDDDNAPHWKSNLATKALTSFTKHAHRPRDWTKLVYQSGLTPVEILAGDTLPKQDAGVSEDVDVDDDEFFKMKKVDTSDVDTLDQTKELIPRDALVAWGDEALLDSIRHLFITGPSGTGDGDESGDGYEDVSGDFEDLEDVSVSEPAALVSTPTVDPEAVLAAKKVALKAKFDEQYDTPSAPATDFYTEKKDELSRQLALNRAEFASLDPSARVLLEGFRPGTYVRIKLSSAPAEFITHFDPSYPLIVGGLAAAEAEARLGIVQVRVKRHRWHTRPLKTHDPLVLSLGWRRFQTCPLYALDDHSIRMRMLKYTPEHTHCYASFWGPAALPGTGFCAFNTLGSITPGFRVSATGVVLDVDRTARIVKKLKLTGVPYKIYKNTAFVRDMFTSALEVAKFEGASIRTVAGVRGQIKKALPKPDGAFRASFEDKVLMSDIIFLRAWYAVQPRRFYNPVTSLLLADKTRWTGMRLTGQVRREEGLKTPLNVNSTYKRVERPPRRFNPLKIPRGLQAALPYASKPKLMRAQRQQTYLQKRAVVMEPAERRAVALLQQMRALRKEQLGKRKEKKAEAREKHRKKVEKEEGMHEEKEREKRKEAMRAAGIKKKREVEREEGPRKRKRTA